jgi:hypothetical protein
MNDGPHLKPFLAFGDRAISWARVPHSVIERGPHAMIGIRSASEYFHEAAHPRGTHDGWKAQGGR